MNTLSLLPIITLLSISVFASEANSQDLDKAEKGLVVISKFANDICNKPELAGKAQTIEVKGSAKAEASRLVKQLADLKIEGAATFGTSEYEGLLQKDLLPALQDSTKCKERIYNDLKDRFLPKPIEKGPMRGTAIIRDGFVTYEKSGFRFSSATVVSWDSEQADILAAKPPGAKVTGLFLPYDLGAYKHPALDRHAASGILKINIQELEAVRRCPSSGYSYHWFQPEQNAIYCIRTRGGKEYALIRIDAIDDDRVSFDYLYQADGSQTFN